MKILKEGMLSDKGIELECPICHCNFILEDRNDIEHSITCEYSYEGIKEYIYYIAKCPKCAYPWYFGIDPNIMTELSSSFYFIFDRADWKEKFEVSVEDVKHGNNVDNDLSKRAISDLKE